MRAITVLLVLTLLGGCTTAQVAAPPRSLASIDAAEAASRPLRLAYSLKFIQFALSDQDIKALITQNIEAKIPEIAKRHNSESSERMVNVLGQVLVSEINQRIPEVKEILAGVYADIFNTEEMRRMSEFASLPATIKYRSKQSLTDQEKAELAALKPEELRDLFNSKKDDLGKLARVRGEIWGRQLMEEIIARNPEKFRERAA